MASVSPAAPPVRHGTCRLSLIINGTSYALRRRKPAYPGSRIWALTKPDGTAHVVAKARGIIDCTCPDARYRKARCKHMRALIAAGLLNGRGCPTMAAVVAEAKGGENHA